MKDEGAGTARKPMVVSHEDWLAARMDLLLTEKEFTRLRDDLSRLRSAMPWEAVGKKYVFEGPNGKESLADLFEGRSQLIVYHFMFDPSWEAGCPHCSFWADNFNGTIVHLNHRDITMIAVSRAPYGKLAAYEKRMGWSFKWVSSFGNDFNFDYQASFTPEEVAKREAFYNFKMQKTPGTDAAGVSVFCKDASGRVFHSYSAYARGIDMLNGAYNYIDLTPKGRDEGDRTQYWVRRHDEYDK
jgi:predicted dithiol-disulfide oxidoreductase (DUF899 family)